MKIKIGGIIIIFAFCMTAVEAQKLKNDVDSLSYAFGIMYGRQIQSGGFQNINPEMFASAIQKVLQNEAVEMTPEQANLTVNMQYQKILQNRAEKNLKAGQEFLNKNRNAPGVVSLPSGLQYKIITAGTGEKPTATDRVKVHYHGTLIDGAVFDSSVERSEPSEFGVNQVIRGWTEALQLMPAGSKWILYIPENLAYGESPRPGGKIEPNMTLIFEVELLSIIKN